MRFLKASITVLLGAIPVSAVGAEPARLVNATEVEKSIVPEKTQMAPVIVRGSKFFNSETGEQFFIKGIAYQPSIAAGDGEFTKFDSTKFIDAMAQPAICLRDLPHLVELGINTVRVYSVDPERDHDECFEAFAAAGIYVLADLSEPDVSVVRSAPVWDVTIYERYKSVVDSLHKYDNLLGFFAGNEVTNDVSNTDASPFVKSSIRDIKSYIKSQQYRDIPVGYASNDDAETRSTIASYFTCGEVSADFYGINMYEWCGYSSYWASGYRERTEEFKDFPVPVFFSEFGCNVIRPRPFTEVEALFSRLMTEVWSGGIAYMYFEEPNEYGVVQIVQGEVQRLDDYDNLKNEFAKVTPKGVSIEEYKSTSKFSRLSQCPKSTKSWQASTFIPHTPDSVKCDCMESSLQCKLNPYVKPSELIHIFQYACGVTDCSAISGDGKDGVYGDFSDCSSKQKASYVINEVFKLDGGKQENCDFNGLAFLNPGVASTLELESLITHSGQSCASILRRHNLKRVKDADPKNSTTNGTVSTTNSSIHGHELESKARSQKLFYQNIVNAVCGSFLFVAILAFYN